MVKFSEFIYTKPGIALELPNVYLPGIENGKWDYVGCTDRSIDKNKFEDFKTIFYKFQGWEASTGYPTQKALEDVDLVYVADELEKRNRIGKA